MHAWVCTAVISPLNNCCWKTGKTRVIPILVLVIESIDYVSIQMITNYGLVVIYIDFRILNLNWVSWWVRVVIVEPFVPIGSLCQIHYLCLNGLREFTQISTLLNFLISKSGLTLEGHSWKLDRTHQMSWVEFNGVWVRNGAYLRTKCLLICLNGAGRELVYICLNGIKVSTQMNLFFFVLFL